MPLLRFDPGAMSGRDMYRLLTSLVVPRPIAWVSTLGASGVRNLAPHSYFNVISSAPPVLHFTSVDEKDSLRNVRATGEFVVSIVDRAHVELMNATAADHPPDEDEFAWAGVPSAESELVAPPRVAGAPAAFECRRHSEVSIGNGTMTFGEVLVVHVDERVWSDGRVDPVALAAVGRLSGSAYVNADDVYKLKRPTWAEVQAAGPGQKRQD